MKKTALTILLLFSLTCISTFLSAQARADENLTYSTSFTDAELDHLLAPIALYPDPLLAQILPASTYPSEIVEADAWLKGGGAISDIDSQIWDESVKAIARYPNILAMMADNMDWTASLGDAFLNQPDEVMRSTQRLRQQALDAGNLTTTHEQQVIIEDTYITIIPAQPAYVYVPQYDPLIVYVRRRPPGMPPFIIFPFRLVIGGWLGLDFDWGCRCLIYHGWHRPGWVDSARPWVHRKNVFVDRSRPDLRRTWRHDASHGNPERYLESRPGPAAGRYSRAAEIRGRAATPPGPSGDMFGTRGDAQAYSNRGRESRGTVNQMPASPVQNYRHQPVPLRGPVPAAPRVSGDLKPPDRDRGNVQAPRNPSVTFGGYRSSDEAREQSIRGKTSRQSGEGGHAAAPAGRGGTSGRGNAPRDKQHQ